MNESLRSPKRAPPVIRIMAVTPILTVKPDQANLPAARSHFDMHGALIVPHVFQYVFQSDEIDHIRDTFTEKVESDSTFAAVVHSSMVRSPTRAIGSDAR